MQSQAMQSQAIQALTTQQRLKRIMARNTKGRDISGIVLLDKSSGMTSNRALQKVKSLFFARKAGHTGSLDPLASGLLPICIGHATKISGYLLDASKRYEVEAKIGERTNTADADGDVTETSPVRMDAEAFAAALEAFIGDSEQVPPMYSAVRHNGERLYKLARKGEVVERPARKITIYSMAGALIDEDTFKLSVFCSKGTYIRTLVEDIAGKLGTLAHVTKLRRVAAGPFDGSGMLTLVDMVKQHQGAPENLDDLLLPVEAGLPDWPSLACDEETTFYLKNGQAVQFPDAPTAGQVSLHRAEGGFIGIGEVLPDGRIAPRRLFC